MAKATILTKIIIFEAAIREIMAKPSCSTILTIIKHALYLRVTSIHFRSSVLIGS